MGLSQAESLFYQSIALCMLLSELHKSDFLNSDFYKKKCFQGKFKIYDTEILSKSGIGNPATLLFMYYLLLLCPRETLQAPEKKELEVLVNKFCENHKKEVPPYENNDHDYYRHIRNAIAHVHCFFNKIDGDDCVIFSDGNSTSPFKMAMTTQDAGMLLDILQNKMVEFLNIRLLKKL